MRACVRFVFYPVIYLELSDICSSVVLYLQNIKDWNVYRPHLLHFIWKCLQTEIGEGSHTAAIPYEK